MSDLTLAMMVGGLWAQNPNIIDKTRSTMNSVQEQKTNDSNAALAGVGTPQTGKPAPGAPATKPAPALVLKPANAAASKPAPAVGTPVKAVAKPTAVPTMAAWRYRDPLAGMGQSIFFTASGRKNASTAHIAASAKAYSTNIETARLIVSRFAVSLTASA